MAENKVVVCCTAFMCGWVMFLGSAIFRAILGGHPGAIDAHGLNQLYHIIDTLPYVGVLLIIIPTVVFFVAVFHHRSSKDDQVMCS